MILIDPTVDFFRRGVRLFMEQVAKLLDKVSGGMITPNSVTIFGLLAHIPVAYLIITYHPIRAAVLLVVFGLMDTLDGALARLQKLVSDFGMVLDATSDRAKEVILYGGVVYVLVESKGAAGAMWAVAALGGSFLVSYSKARGEVAIKNSKLSTAEVNKVFADGLMRFELRMFALVVGLLSGYLYQAVIVVAVLSWLTALGRLIRIAQKIN